MKVAKYYRFAYTSACRSVVVPIKRELFHTVFCHMNSATGAMKWRDNGVRNVWLPQWATVLREQLIIAELSFTHSAFYGGRSLIAVNSHMQYLVIAVFCLVGCSWASSR
jgi:hypothetical protein